MFPGESLHPVHASRGLPPRRRWLRCNPLITARLALFNAFYECARLRGTRNDKRLHSGQQAMRTFDHPV